MGLDETTRSVLKFYTSQRVPLSGDTWYGPWITILTTLFPAAEGYVIEPALCDVKPGDYSLSDIIMRVIKFSSEDGGVTETVLVLQCRSSYRWSEGVPYFEKLVERRMQSIYRDDLLKTIHWIIAVGPHWRYGKSINEQRLDVAEETMIPLIEWQDTTHDDASYDHLCALKRIIDQVAVEEVSFTSSP